MTVKSCFLGLWNTRQNPLYKYQISKNLLTGTLSYNQTWFWTRKRKISKQKLDCSTYIVGELTLDICRILHLASQILSRIFFFSSKLNLSLDTKWHVLYCTICRKCIYETTSRLKHRGGLSTNSDLISSISACIVYKNSEILFNIFLFQPLKEPWMGVQYYIIRLYDL